MENMCSNCGFYKTPPLFWGGSTEPSLCDCPKERSYSEEEVLTMLLIKHDGLTPEYVLEQFKKK